MSSLILATTVMANINDVSNHTSNKHTYIGLNYIGLCGENVQTTEICQNIIMCVIEGSIAIFIELYPMTVDSMLVRRCVPIINDRQFIQF